MSQTQSQPNKEAPTDYPILDLLKKRWSPRAFADTPVEAEKLALVLEAARWAPSSSNQQPWRFLVTKRGTEGFDTLVSCLREGNKAWAPRAPVLILTVADTQFPAKGDRPARENRYAFHDVGLAVGNLSVQATAVGLFVHQMAGFYPERAKEAFAIPDPFEPVTVLALGYLGDASDLPNELRAREAAPRTRKPLEELVYEGGWNARASFLGR